MSYLHRMNWKRVRDSLKKLGAPTNAKDLGLERDEVVKALEVAATLRPERYTILNKLNLDRAAYERLAEKTGVI